MESLASRTESDAGDIALPYNELGLTTVEQGLDLVSAANPGRPIAPRVQYLLDEVVASLPGRRTGSVD